MTTPSFEGRPLANPDESLYDQGLQFDVETLVDRRHVLKLIGYAGLSAGLLSLVGCNTSNASPSATRAATLAAPSAGGTATASAAASAAASASSSAAASTAPSAGVAASPSAAASTAPSAGVAASPSAAASTAASAAASAAASGAGTSTSAPAGSQLPSATAGATAATDCDTAIPEETAGPFPGDGSNGPDVLTLSGVVRQDLRSSFGGASGTADGVPLTIRLAIQDLANSCAPLASAAVYVWHCDREGRYSLYSPGATDQNYLRGVQAAGADGIVTFTSIFPACYQGRWPHIHFEVYPSVAAATDPRNRIATSQVALPEDACTTVYATSGYEQSVRNLSQVSLARDNVFGDDGGIHELGAITGDVTSGMTVTLNVPVRAA